MKESMKLAFKALVVSGLLLTATLGIFAIGCIGLECGHNTHRWCFASQAEASPCPENGGALEFVNFHIGALKIFSRAIFSQDLLGYFIMLIAAIAIAGLMAAAGFWPQQRFALQPRSKHSWELRVFSPEHQVRRWLALHENSPANL